MSAYNELEFFQHFLPNGDWLEWELGDENKRLISGKDQSERTLSDAEAFNLIRGDA